MEVYAHDDFSEITDIKADNSPLTLADKASHRVISEALEKMNTGIPLISEEGREITYEERSQWDTFWLVDPLDGTKEFIKRNGNFTVNIALIKDKKSVLGVIYVPVQQKMYWAEEGKGAFMHSPETGTQELKVNGKADKKDIIAVMSSSHASQMDLDALSAYEISGREGIGSSLKFCLVAEGKADVYYRGKPTMEWDTAAGQAIVEEAGGNMYHEDGKPFRYNKSSLRNSSFLCEGF